MKWLIAKNNKAVRVKEIPVLGINEFRSQIVRRCGEGKRVVSFFGDTGDKTTTLYVVLADDENSKLYLSSAAMGKERSYPSITAEVPAFHIFEREMHEETGIVPEGHPWLKGVRFPYNRHDPARNMEAYPFFKMTGEEVHEVAVGPIHAGVIEPGHFRFMCQGEDVHHLEIQLGYQHRGVKDLLIKKQQNAGIHIAESIAGDTVIGHGMAYAAAMEALAGADVPRRAQSIRAIALEMERAAIHIGDLGAIANDVAYLIGNAVFGATRTIVINSLLAICGSRFGRGLIRPGGVVFDISADLGKELQKNLEKVRNDIMLMGETMLDSASVLSRLDHTGTVDTETATAIGLVGPAGRASGVQVDVRSDHPFGIYRYYPLYKRVFFSGDVFARTYIRYLEIKQSIDYIAEQLDVMSDERPIITPLKKAQADSLVVSMTEGWRGEIVHVAMTGKNGALRNYQVKDPSLNNWYGLALAVRNQGISDFPLCNKSFNLSYCGNDL